MPYTFECGSCQAVYRLDESQITPDGIKVTCPKCMNYFVLRRGAKTTDRPTIERVIADGRYEIYMPPPTPHSRKLDQLLSDDDLDPSFGSAVKTEIISEDVVTSKPSPPPVKPVPSKQKERSEPSISHKDLNDYPQEDPPRSRLDQILIPFSLALVVLAGLLFLNYEGILRIPGLEFMRRKEVPPIYIPIRTSPSSTTDGKTPKHGFPNVDPEYNPWEEEGAKKPN